MSKSKEKAVVLLSGGLDSATCLGVATQQNLDCYCLSFNYGQRHNAELIASANVAKFFNAKEHKIFNIDLSQFGGSALTDANISVPEGDIERNTIPITYVPARNTILLSVALAWAEVLQADHLFIGVNAVDYSGYPDCRPEYIKSFEIMANLATKTGIEGNHLNVHTPLIHLKKSEIIQLGLSVGVDYSLTVSCYQANDKGEACGHCDACLLRQQGFQQAEITDPTRYF